LSERQETLVKATKWADELGVTLEEFIFQSMIYQINSFEDGRPDEPLAFVMDVLRDQRQKVLPDKAAVKFPASSKKRRAGTRRGWVAPRFLYQKRMKKAA